MNHVEKNIIIIRRTTNEKKKIFQEMVDRHQKYHKAKFNKMHSPSRSACFVKPVQFQNEMKETQILPSILKNRLSTEIILGCGKKCLFWSEVTKLSWVPKPHSRSRLAWNSKVLAQHPYFSNWIYVISGSIPASSASQHSWWFANSLRNNIKRVFFTQSLVIRNKLNVRGIMLLKISMMFF